jgi:ligand-binding sensor domain-containing protein/signal transduction histidine kinase
MTKPNTITEAETVSIDCSVCGHACCRRTGRTRGSYLCSLVRAKAPAWFFAFWVVLFLSHARAETPSRNSAMTGFTQRLWQSKDGLPDQMVQAFAQTPEGGLWIGTGRGLLRFDGARFVIYDHEIAPDLLEEGVNCLMASQDGSLWIGTEGRGLFHYSDHAFRSYPTSDGFSNSFVRAIYQDRSGKIWVGGDQGLFTVEGSQIHRIDGVNGTPSIFVRAITQDHLGRVWVGGTTLLRFDNSSSVQEVPLEGGPSKNLVTAIREAKDGALWVGTRSGLYQMQNSGTLKRVPGIASAVDVLEENKDGTLWVGTAGQGLFIYRNGAFSHVTAPEFLPSNTVEAIFEDNEKNVWIGTHAGMLRLSKTPVSIIPFPGGEDSEYKAIYQDHDGSIWVTASSRLFHIRGGVARPYVFPNLPGVRVRTLMRDRAGDLWLGTDGTGLIRLEGTHITRYTTGNGRLINDFIRVILQGRDGSMWVGTDGGITHLRGNLGTNFGMRNGLAYFNVTALLQDRTGDIWAGTSRGLSHMHEGHFLQDAATRALRHEKLWSIHEDADGGLWFATSRGLYRFRQGNLHHFSTADGLAGNIIYKILEDSAGNMWLSGPSGISRLKRHELDALADGSLRQLSLTLYVSSYDMEYASLYGGIQPAGWITKQGDVWFPSNLGAVHVAADQTESSSPPRIAIDQVVVDGQVEPSKGKIVLKPGNSRLEISYIAMRLRSQEALRYRYRMEVLEPWTEAYTRRTAYYTNLKAGKYTFQVQVFEVSNPREISGTSIEIVQEPHFYRTPWFLSACIIAVCASVFGIHQFRLHQMTLRFQAVLEERTRLAREMHDTLIQGCVGISTLLEAALEVGASEKALNQQLLNYANEQARTTIDEAREAVWALRQHGGGTEDASLSWQRIAGQFSREFGVPIQCSVSGTPFTLTESQTHELTMVAREAVSNAIVHGHPARIEISVQFLKDGLQLEIQDDGSGFDLAAVRVSNDHRHYGLVGIEERIQLLGGNVEIASIAGKGTVVRVLLPRKKKEKGHNIAVREP